MGFRFTKPERDGRAEFVVSAEPPTPPPAVLVLSADTHAPWPDYVAVSVTTEHATDVRLELEGYVTQTVTAAEAAAGVRLVSDGTAPVVAQGGLTTLTVTPLSGTEEGAPETRDLVTYHALEAWLAHWGLTLSGDDVTEWTGQVLATPWVPLFTPPDRIASDPLFAGHDSVDFDGSEWFVADGLAALFSGRTEYTLLDVTSVAHPGGSAYRWYTFDGVTGDSHAAYRYAVGTLWASVTVGGATSSVSAALVGTVTGVLASRYAGAEAAPRYRIYLDGLQISGAETAPFPAALPPMNLGSVGAYPTGSNLLVHRLAARFLFGEALPEAAVADLSAFLHLRYFG